MSEEKQGAVIASTYQIEKQIGAGGAGIVYRGRHLRLDIPLVLKADRRALSRSMQTLRREVEALKHLHHTYIPQVYDFVPEGGTVYTVMEYIEGESLDKPLQKGVRFPQWQVIDWACQILDALVYLHSVPPHGILHSDIKPSNIMLTPRGDIRLIDFNIALALGENGTVRVGYSRGYASPEHYAVDDSVNTGRITSSGKSAESLSASGAGEPSGKNVKMLDVRSDIYSLGATLYHLLTGVKPPENAWEVPPIRSPYVSHAVSDIIEKAMNPDPNGRYQSAREMREAFLNLRRNDSRAKRLRRVTAVAAVVLTLLFLGGGFLAFVGQRQVAGLQRAYALAEQSQTALRSGDVHSAVDLAAEALTLRRGIFDPPNTAEAQKALTDALGVYNLSGGFAAFQTLELPSEPLKVTFSPDGGRLAVIYAWQAAVYDTQSGECLCALDAEESALSDALFLDNNRIVYAGRGAIRAYDLRSGAELWSGEPATRIVRSADGRRVAAVYKDAETAFIYDAETGALLRELPFYGRKQWVPANPVYSDSGDNLFALNGDGSQLAVSFEDGGLIVFYLNSENEQRLTLLDTSDYVHFEGGFHGSYFVYSAFTSLNGGASELVIMDTAAALETVRFSPDSRVSVQADEHEIVVSYGNHLLLIDPETAAQTFAATTERDITLFRRADGYAITAETPDSETGRFSFFDRGGEPLGQTETDAACDFVDIAGEFALVANSKSPTVRILRLDNHAESRIFSYDPSVPHSEARLSADEQTVMLFRYDSFHIYDLNGEEIIERAIPDAGNTYDHQFRRQGTESWLEVTYNDGFVREYSARDGEILREYQGDAPDLSLDEEFLTEHFRIVRTAHGTPVAYDRRTGKQIRELEQNDTLIYVDELGEYLITWYFTAQARIYGLALNEKCQTLARIPSLCDVTGGRIILDYASAGELKESPLYSLEELLAMADADS